MIKYLKNLKLKYYSIELLNLKTFPITLNPELTLKSFYFMVIAFFIVLAEANHSIYVLFRKGQE